MFGHASILNRIQKESACGCNVTSCGRIDCQCQVAFEPSPPLEATLEATLEGLGAGSGLSEAGGCES